MNKYKDLLKNTAIFALGNVGSKIILFLLVPLYTNYMTPEEYGTADLIFTVSQLILPIISIVIYDSIIRFGLSKYEKSENVLLCGYIILIIGSCTLLLITPLLNNYDAISNWKWYLVIYVIGNFCLSINMNYLKVKDFNLIYSLISIFQTFCMALINIILLVCFKYGIRGYLLSNIISVYLSIFISFIKGNLILELKKACFEKVLFIKMIKYSAPLILNNISWWIIQSSDRIMVQFMLGSAALGLYTVAAKIPSLINVVTNIFTQAWGLSSVKEIESSNENEFYSNVLNVYIFISFGLCIVFTSFIKPFISIYVGKSFGESWKYVPILLCAASFASIAYYYGALYGALKKSINNMVSTLISAVVNIILNFILINYFGLYGATVSTLVAYIFMANLRMFDVQKYIHINLNLKKYFLNCILIIIHVFVVTMNNNIVLFSMLVIFMYCLVNLKTIYIINKKIFSFLKGVKI